MSLWIALRGFMDKLRSRLLGLPRRHKRLIQVATDVILVWFALWLAFVVRLGIDDLANPVLDHTWLFIIAPIISIPLFIRFGLYRAVMRYFGNDALIAIIKAVTLSSLILGFIIYWASNHQNVVPRSITFNYWWLSLIMVGGLRLARMGHQPARPLRAGARRRRGSPAWQPGHRPHAGQARR